MINKYEYIIIKVINKDKNINLRERLYEIILL